MPAPYQLKIITREKVVFDGEIDSLVAPGVQGSLGVWAEHAPLIASLSEGKLWFRDPSGRETTYHLCGGYLEVSDNAASVLADDLTTG